MLQFNVKRLRLGLTSSLKEEATRELDKLLNDQSSFVRFFQGAGASAENLRIRLINSLVDVEDRSVVDCWAPILQLMFPGQFEKYSLVSGESYPAQFKSLAVKLEAFHVDYCARLFLVNTPAGDISSEFPTSPQASSVNWEACPPFIDGSSSHFIRIDLQNLLDALRKAAEKQGRNMKQRISDAVDIIPHFLKHFTHTGFPTLSKDPNKPARARNAEEYLKEINATPENVSGSLFTDLVTSDGAMERYMLRLSAAYSTARAMSDLPENSLVFMPIKLALARQTLTFDDPSSLSAAAPPGRKDLLTVIKKYGPDAVAALMTSNPALGFQTLLSAVSDLLLDSPESAVVADLSESVLKRPALYHITHELKRISDDLEKGKLPSYDDAKLIEKVKDVQYFLPALIGSLGSGLFKGVKKLVGGLFGKKKKKKKKQKMYEALLAQQQMQQAATPAQSSQSYPQMGASSNQFENGVYNAPIERSQTPPEELESLTGDSDNDPLFAAEADSDPMFS